VVVSEWYWAPAETDEKRRKDTNMNEFFIYSKLNADLVIDIKGAKNTPGLALQVYRKNYGQNQLWTLPQLSGSTYIQSRLNNSTPGGGPLVIAIQGGQAIARSLLEVNGASAAPSQLWTFLPIPGQPVPIYSSLDSTMVIDIRGAHNTSGTPIQVYHSNNGANQLWSLSPLYTASIATLSESILIANVDPPLGINASFSITNSGGRTWTGFHLTVTNPQGGQPPHFVAPYSGPGSCTLSGANVQNAAAISGLNIPPAGQFRFSIDVLYGEGGWYLTGFPSAT
jgi:hypothetical protein